MLIQLKEKHFIINQPVQAEEDRYCEFKEVKGNNPLKSIVNTADNYAVAYLNSNGGQILWGINDEDRSIVGVNLNYEKRDELRQKVTRKLSTIQPSVDPTQFQLNFHEVYNDVGDMVSDLWVVELSVSPPISPGPYFTGGNEAWVKVDGVKQKLMGPALVEWIKRHQGIPDEPILTFELNHFLYIIKELMPIFHWLHSSVPSKHAKKYFSALQEFFHGNSFNLNKNLQFGTDNLLRVISTSSIINGYGYEKMKRAFECFIDYLDNVDTNIDKNQFDIFKFNMRDFILISKHKFESALASNKIFPREIPFIRFIIALLQYTEDYIRSGSPKKYPEVPELLTREFQSFFTMLFDINLRVTFPDSLSMDCYNEIRELCKNEWEIFCSNYGRH